MRVALSLLFLCGGCVDIDSLRSTYCENAGAKLCDGFESGKVDTSLWKQSTMTGATLDVLPPGFHNNFSLVAAAAIGTVATLADDTVTPLLGGAKDDNDDTGDIFFRFRILLADSPADYGDTTLVTFGDAGKGVSFGLHNGQGVLTDSAGGISLAPSPFVDDVWFCFELDYVRDNGPKDDPTKAAKPGVELFVNEVDGASASPLISLGTTEIPTNATTQIGIDRTTAAMDKIASALIVYDDVIIDDKHIGCTK